MASLKDLRLRITSVQSTKKITSAMKMVAASKLRRAQEAAEQARRYAQRMEAMLGNLAASAVGQAGAPPLLGAVVTISTERPLRSACTIACSAAA